MDDDYRPAEEPELSEADREMAQEVAVFIANRAFSFDDRECRAWALTDFGVWATLAGRDPELSLRPRGSARRPSDEADG